MSVNRAIVARDLHAECPRVEERGLRRVLQYAETMAARYRPHLVAYNGLCPEDLEQEAVLGVIQAARGYDPTRGTRFVTWAHRAIFMRITSALRQASSVPDWRQTEIRRWERDGILPLGKSESQVRRQPQEEAYVSLDAPTETDTDEPISGAIPGPLDTEAEALEAVAREELWELVDSLSAVDREVLYFRFREGRQLKELGDEQGLTRQAISLRQRKALKRLKVKVLERGLV